PAPGGFLPLPDPLREAGAPALRLTPRSDPHAPEGLPAGEGPPDVHRGIPPEAEAELRPGARRRPRIAGRVPRLRVPGDARASGRDRPAERGLVAGPLVPRDARPRRCREGGRRSGEAGALRGEAPVPTLASRSR